MKSLLLKTLTVVLVSSLFFTSCVEETPPEVSLHFTPKVGTEDFAMNQTFTINNVATSFSQVYFYVHDVTLKGASGTEDQLFDQYFLISANQSTYELGAVEEGTITGIDFNVGVDAVSNAQTEEAFTTRSADDPLAQQDPSMHWTWATGYRFIRIEGLVDTDGDGVPEEPFARHLGKNEMLRAISLTTSKEITGDAVELMIMFDLAKFLEGSDLIGTATIHGMDANMMDMVQAGFSVM